MVHALAKRCGAKTVVDVGSGQVCRLHANICATVTRFQEDIIVFLILGQLANILLTYLRLEIKCTSQAIWFLL